MQNNLGNCLQIIDDEVMKGYITRLDKLDIIVPSEASFSELKKIHFFRITELVYDKNEFSVHKFATMFHTLSNKPCTLVLMLQSDGRNTNFYLGVRSESDANSTGTMCDMLKESLKSQFQGSNIELYPYETLTDDLNKFHSRSISSVTCIADYKQNDEQLSNNEFVQGLEKFVNSMNGKTYKAFFIANNISHDELMEVKQEYENIYTQISPFSDVQFNFSVSESSSTADGTSSGTTSSQAYGVQQTYGENYGLSKAGTIGSTATDGYSDTEGTSSSVSNGTTYTKGSSVTNSTSDSLSHTEGKSVSDTIGGSLGVSAGGVVNAGVNKSKSHSRFTSDTTTHTIGRSVTESFSESVSKTLTEGTNKSHSDNHSISKSSSVTNTISSGYNESNGSNYSISEAFNFVNSKTLTDTFGNSKAVTLNAKNKTLISVLNRLEKQLDRIDECESVGMWHCAAYFLGTCIADTETAANTYRSLMSGRESGIERSSVNTWAEERNSDAVKALEKYLKNFVHPQFVYNGVRTTSIVNPSVMISTNELAIHMGLPRKSVSGLAVVEHTPFALDVLCNHNDNDSSLSLGKIFHLTEELETPVELDIDSLTMHTFVTGSTGSGKSNTVYQLLNELSKKQIPYLVIEPAKGEYRKVFSNATVYDTNPRNNSLLRINPFSFPDNIHVLEHIDHLIEIFNVCWPMYAAMPAVLKDSVVRAYTSAGWDLDLSVNTKVDGLFPTFDDVLRELKYVINTSEYSVDTKNDYIGSLSTRIKSLTNGINGRIFVGNEIGIDKILYENTIIDLSKIGASETKSLIMGLFILKLKEYRDSNKKEMNSGLKHITVIEEAHNILKKTSFAQNQESSNVQGKAVEMLTNAIAEMRTYGEGFVIVDQAPDMLDTAVIRNTNTKIVMKLPESNDREITGKSISLNDEQISELSKLKTGVAAVYQNNWQEAVLCKINFYKVKSNLCEETKKTVITSYNNENKEILHMLIKHGLECEEIDKLKSKIFNSCVSAQIKRNLICNLECQNIEYEWAVADFINKCFNCNNVFRGAAIAECQSLDKLAEVAVMNIRNEFEEFSDKEMKKILYFICRTQHELHPECRTIEALRTEYLKKELDK